MPLIKRNQTKTNIPKHTGNISINKSNRLLIVCFLLATSLLTTGCTKEEKTESSKNASANKEQIKSQNNLELSNSTDFVPASSNSEVAEIANTITVRIEGATQGSGVLVKREGNQYTILTSWHVVSGTKKGEELDIYTSDGERHQYQQGSIKKIGDVDMAILIFKSKEDYKVATIGNADTISMGESIFVSGFPLTTSAVPKRIIRFLKGDVIANADAVIPKGYQLLYSNKTLPGMSGGSVMNERGRLIGIHGQGEIDSKETIAKGIAVKTGTNQGVPINYYIVINPVFIGKHDGYNVPDTESKEFDNLIAEAKSLQSRYQTNFETLESQYLKTEEWDHEIWTKKFNQYILDNIEMVDTAIAKTEAALAIRNSKEAYLILAVSYKYKKHQHLHLHFGKWHDSEESTVKSKLRTEWNYRNNEYKNKILNSLNASIEIDPFFVEALQRRGELKEDIETGSGLEDFEQILKVDKNNINATRSRAYSYYTSIIKNHYGQEKYEQLLFNEYQKLVSLGGEEPSIKHHMRQKKCNQEYKSKSDANWTVDSRSIDAREVQDVVIRKEFTTCLAADP